MKKTKTWIAIFALVLFLALSLALWHGAPGQTATLWLNGELYQTIDLSAVTQPYEFDVVTEWGTNTVRVQPGGISVSWADCPDQLCVQQGVIDSSAIPITCLPHRLVIQIEENEG